LFFNELIQIYEYRKIISQILLWRFKPFPLNPKPNNTADPCP